MLHFAQRGQGTAQRRRKLCQCASCGFAAVPCFVSDFFGVDEQPLLCDRCLATPDVRQQWHAPKVRVVAGLLPGNDRTYLIGQRSHGRFAGCWEFPGGKVEPGESPRSALRREWREELGVDILPLRPVSAWACKDWQITLYAVGLLKGVPSIPTALASHSALQYACTWDIALLPGTPSMAPLLARL